MTAKVKITERGWPGHFCEAHKCLFRRNTLIEYGEKRLVVSTVGGLQREDRKTPIEPLGADDRYFETMVFKAKLHDGKYWDANVKKQIFFEGDWKICAKSFNDLPDYFDILANEMHDKTVENFSKKIKLM